MTLKEALQQTKKFDTREIREREVSRETQTNKVVISCGFIDGKQKVNKSRLEKVCRNILKCTFKVRETGESM